MTLAAWIGLGLFGFVKPVVFETITEFQEYMLENRGRHYENGIEMCYFLMRRVIFII